MIHCKTLNKIHKRELNSLLSTLRRVKKVMIYCEKELLEFLLARPILVLEKKIENFNQSICTKLVSLRNNLIESGVK